MIDPTNYTFGLPIAASTYATRIDDALHLLHWVMGGIFVVWGIFFALCLVRFRRSKNPQADYNIVKKGGVASFVPDAAVLVFELWLIFAIGFPIWATIKDEMPSDANANVVELVAEQFAWGFQYPGADGVLGRRDPQQINSGNTIGIDWNDPAAKDDIVSINELHVPLDKPTILYMTSKDVIHSFFVPEFRVKQDVVPGMRIPLWFQATKVGRYEIGCAQLCGLGHYRMKGEVVVHSPEEFEAWKVQQRNDAEGDQESL